MLSLVDERGPVVGGLFVGVQTGHVRLEDGGRGREEEEKMEA